MPATFLSAGQSGKQGSSQIRIVRDDLTEATYPKRYVLNVTHFDVVDENEDGINEPGEHIIVSNIKVKNTGTVALGSSHIRKSPAKFFTGGMPSPHRNRIRL